MQALLGNQIEKAVEGVHREHKIVSGGRGGEGGPRIFKFRIGLIGVWGSGILSAPVARSFQNLNALDFSHVISPRCHSQREIGQYENLFKEVTPELIILVSKLMFLFVRRTILKNRLRLLLSKCFQLLSAFLWKFHLASRTTMSMQVDSLPLHPVPQTSTYLLRVPSSSLRH